MNREMYDMRVRVEDVEKNLVETDNEVATLQEEVQKLHKEIESLRLIVYGRYEALLKEVLRLSSAVMKDG